MRQSDIYSLKYIDYSKEIIQGQEYLRCTELIRRCKFIIAVLKFLFIGHKWTLIKFYLYGLN